MLLLKVTEVTTGDQKLLKIGTNSVKSSFFAPRNKKKKRRLKAEARSLLQELEVNLLNGLYLLVSAIEVLS